MAPIVKCQQANGQRKAFKSQEWQLCVGEPCRQGSRRSATSLQQVTQIGHQTCHRAKPDAQAASRWESDAVTEGTFRGRTMLSRYDAY